MSIASIFVVYAVTWFMVFFIVLPLRVTSQAESGKVVPGTPAGAPAGYVIKRKAITTTIAATVIWAIIVGVILSGVITIRDIDVMNRMHPAGGGLYRP
ncbi:DUF1467 family protein [Pseudorhodobacter sp.]|uniref:DUF1467 family protein n=1 Tax=Pseudorhodobacter sp. TaxID=1934400 RepID=UPI002648E797|nr:DUF1467 family protein [Pseudorhodobacter sp.]MDN5786026.1 DUF1467 family protein [Pseudorhodobacter sp.]